MTDAAQDRIEDLHHAARAQLTGHDPSVVAAVVALALQSPTRDELSALRTRVDEQYELSKPFHQQITTTRPHDPAPFTKEQIDSAEFQRGRSLTRIREAIDLAKDMVDRGLRP